MRKIFVVTLLTGLLLASNLPFQSIAQSLQAVYFQDTAGHWSRDFDLALRQNCQIEGFKDSQGNLLNLFKPDQSITRAELVKMVLQCKNGPAYQYENSYSFPDVDVDSWASPYIAAGQKAQLVGGYPDGNFRPEQSVNRAEALKIILLSKFQENLFSEGLALKFLDAPASSWYSKYLAYAVQNQIVSGFPDQTFRPGQAITRAEAAKIISQVYNLSVLNPPSLPPVDQSSDSPVIAGCPIFPADNPWNQNISNLPVDRNSANYLASIGIGKYLHPDFGSPAEYGIPFTVVDGSATPKVNVQADYADESDFGQAPIPSNAPIEGTAASNGDRHVIVLDKINCLLYEMWDSHFNGSGWDVGSSAKFDLKSNSLRPDGWTSADAAGLPILPGLVRYDEVKAGVIHHAIRFTASHTQKAYLHPATHFASSSTDSNLPPMGLRIRLKADFDISSYTSQSRVILEAFKTYGLILADNGSDWFFTGESNPNWDDEALNQLKSIPGSAFEVVDTGEPIHR